MTQIQLRRGTASAWTTADPILALGEVGIETNTLKSKVGDGVSSWSELDYMVTAWSDVAGKPAIIAAGVSKADARDAIDAAALDESGMVPSAQLPSYVDDVLEYANLGAFPGFGTAGKIYVATDNGKVYRWSGSTYIEISPSPGSTDSVAEGSTNLYYTNSRADARIAAAVGVSVQGYDSDLASFAGKTAPTGDVVGTSDSQTLSGKTLTNPTVNNYTEGVVAIGTVTSAHTISLTSGTVQTATLTASTAATFTMPTATAGKSFVLLLKQAASTGNGTATFTGVKWATASAPTVTAGAGKMDIFSFFADGTNWYGSVAQGYTP